MPPRPRRVFTSRPRTSRRRLTWADSGPATAVVGTSGHSVNSDLLALFKTAGGEVNGSTVIRTHLWLAPSSTVAVNDQFKWGIMVAGQSQIATSFVTGSGFYETVTFPYVDWMLARAEVAAPLYGNWGASHRVEVDLRSKRKILDLGETLMLSTSSVAVGASLSVVYYARVLLALP